MLNIVVYCGHYDAASEIIMKGSSMVGEVSDQCAMISPRLTLLLRYPVIMVTIGFNFLPMRFSASAMVAASV